MKSTLPISLSLQDVLEAQARIGSGIRRTPCTRLPDRPEFGGMEIWAKREDLQRTRSFKERGALNALLSLSAQQSARGVVAASAGNHASGLAYHGGRLGIAVTVVMPVGAPAAKINRCRGLGAEVVLQGNNFEQAEAHAVGLAEQTGKALIHPFEQKEVMAGQGTIGLEIIHAVPEFDAVLVPVGGGGLLAGVATAIKALRPTARVIAVQSEQAASYALSHARGEPAAILTRPTLADGLAVARVGAATFRISAPLVDQVVTVSEAEIRAAIRLFSQTGITAEGAGAAALAAILACKVSARRAVVLVTGGNIDAKVLDRVLTDELAATEAVRGSP
jgi:threonine dehydratase